jgi:hypothetical protein
MSIEAAPRRPPSWIGLASFILAALLVALEGVAIGIGSNRDWTTATVLAWVVIALTIASFLGGLTAVALRLGRRWGLAATTLSVAGNPLVLVWLFAIIGNS